MLSKMAEETANSLALVLISSPFLLENCDIKVSIRERRASVFVPLVLMLILMSQGVLTCFISGVCAYDCVLVKTRLNGKVFLIQRTKHKRCHFLSTMWHDCPCFGSGNW